MSDGRYRTIWISDVHLGTRECRADVLLAFLEGHDCDYLYLVGDVIDFWRLRREPQWPQLHSDVIRKVLVTKYLRRFCDLQLGNIMVTREAVHRTADGRLLLVLHGDDFDGVTRWNRWMVRLGGAGYTTLTALNRWFNGARRLLGFGYWSLSGYLKGRVKPVVEFVTAFEAALVHEAARRQLGGVVSGHIHRAALRSDGPVLYANCGDWVESCTAIVEHADGRLELVSAAPGRHIAARVAAGEGAR